MTTHTLTLAEFVTARLDEDEAAARAAASAGGKNWDALTYRVVVDDEFEVADASVPAAAHIARHDPARVLAQCAALRRLVEQWEGWAARCSPGDWPEEGGMENAALADSGRWMLRVLAGTWSDHSDFNPDAWA